MQLPPMMRNPEFIRKIEPDHSKRKNSIRCDPRVKDCFITKPGFTFFIIKNSSRWTNRKRMSLFMQYSIPAALSLSWPYGKSAGKPLQPAAFSSPRFVINKIIALIYCGVLNFTLEYCRGNTIIKNQHQSARLPEIFFPTIRIVLSPRF